jgi:hypothetical protein
MPTFRIKEAPRSSCRDEAACSVSKAMVADPSLRRCADVGYPLSQLPRAEAAGTEGSEKELIATDHFVSEVAEALCNLWCLCTVRPVLRTASSSALRRFESPSAVNFFLLLSHGGSSLAAGRGNRKVRARNFPHEGPLLASGLLAERLVCASRSRRRGAGVRHCQCTHCGMRNPGPGSAPPGSCLARE